MKIGRFDYFSTFAFAGLCAAALATTDQPAWLWWPLTESWYWWVMCGMALARALRAIIGDDRLESWQREDERQAHEWNYPRRPGPRGYDGPPALFSAHRRNPQ